MSARRKRHFEQELFEFAQEDGERKKGVDELFTSVEEFSRISRFTKLLELVSHFSDYSPNNALMIALQRPSARFVLTPRRWQALNRFVKRGAAPIVVLRPFSPVVYLYDVADTKVMSGRDDGFDSSQAEISQYEPLAEVPPETLRSLVGNLPLWGIAHGTFPSGPSMSVELRVSDDTDESLTLPLGKENVSCRPAYVLRTREGAPDTVVFSAIVQALARIFCRHLRCGYERGWELSRRVKADVEQFEVQVVAWLVCRRLQVASPSYSFLADYKSERSEIPAVSMEAIFDAVTEIERMLEPCNVQQGFLYRHTPSLVEHS